MKKNLDLQKIFESLSPDGEEIEKMEKNILLHTKPEPGRRVRFMPIAAAVLITMLGITSAAAAAPALIRYFFPGVGVVEVPEGTQTPLYMMLDAERDAGRVDLQYGYWKGGDAEVYFESTVRYEERENIGKIEHIGGRNTPQGMIQRYKLTLSDVSAEEASEGINFDGILLKFDRMPAEYRPYTAEDTGLRLTMIPLTKDMSTFSMHLEYLDGRSGLELLSNNLFTDSGCTMFLIDESGNSYPMKRYYNSEIFTIDGTPVSPIAGFRSEKLVFRKDFQTDGLGTSVIVNVPDDGKAETVNLEFTFPDGVTKGRIAVVGHNNAVEFQIPDDRYPMGSLTVITEMLEQGGIRYWCSPHYGESYRNFLNEFLVYEVRSPYDNSPADPMSPYMYYGSTMAGDGVSRTEHYVSDGKETVELVANTYTAEASGNWGIDFTVTK